VSGHLKVKDMPAECSIGLYKLVSRLAVLQDTVLANVQGNGEVPAVYTNGMYVSGGMYVQERLLLLSV
jgi:hypothetical protein